MNVILAALLLTMWAPGAKNYEVQVTADAAKAGKPARATVRLVPKAGFHVNAEFPISLDVKATDDIAISKEKQVKADAKKFSADEATFEVAYTPKSAGDKKLEATFRFAVCTDKDCFPFKEKLTISASVK
jgi:hypothetical protein